MKHSSPLFFTFTHDGRGAPDRLGQLDPELAPLWMLGSTTNWATFCCAPCPRTGGPAGYHRGDLTRCARVKAREFLHRANTKGGDLAAPPRIAEMRPSLQLIGDGIEGAGQLRAEGRHRRNSSDRYEGGDEPVLDGRRARLVVQETREDRHGDVLRSYHRSLCRR